MKETVNASVASQSFVFEADAYSALKSYLDDIAARLSEEERETMQDVEYRLAEIFREQLPSPLMVVTLKQVQEAMARMGRPSDFGELPGEEGGAEPEKEEVRRVLRRSLTDRSIAGVCGGLARFFSVDATLIRLLMLLLILCGGLSIWAYVVRAKQKRITPKTVRYETEKSLPFVGPHPGRRLRRSGRLPGAGPLDGPARYADRNPLSGAFRVGLCPHVADRSRGAG